MNNGNKTVMVLEFVTAGGCLLLSVWDYLHGDAVIGTAMLGLSITNAGLGLDMMSKHKQTEAC